MLTNIWDTGTMIDIPFPKWKNMKEGKHGKVEASANLKRQNSILSCDMKYYSWA